MAQEEGEEEDEYIEDVIRAARNHKTTQLPQYFTALVLSLTGFSNGTVLGWAAPGMEKVRLAHEPGSRTSSWVTAAVPLGGFTATILTALTLNRYGRKMAMLLMIPGYISGWILLAFGDHLAAYIIGRYVAGLSGGTFSMVMPIFMGEIAQKEIRGRLCMIFQSALPLGLLYAYVAGFSLSLKTASLLCIIPNVLFFVLMLFIPESPRFLLRKGKIKEANMALQWFRGPDYHIVYDFDKNWTRNLHRNLSIMQMLSTRAAKNTVLMSMVLMICAQLSGFNVVVIFSFSLFQSTDIAVDYQIAFITIATTMWLGCIVAVFAVDRLGRRILLLIAHTSQGICLSLLMLFNWVIPGNEGFHWLPVAFSSMFLFAYAIGTGPIPWILLGELFPYQLKPFAVAWCTSVSWLSSFLVTKTFYLLHRDIGVVGTYGLFSCFCFCNAVIIYFFVMETAGLNLDEIQMIFHRNETLRDTRADSAVLVS